MRRRVFLVDDHVLFRAGVRGELSTVAEIVGEAGSVAEAVPQIKELDPEVVLLDVHLPDGGGEAVIAGVAQERPGVKFLALSVSDAAEDVISVIRAGARGYVTKTISTEELARGYRYKEIAARLHLSIKTVEAHVSSVLRKLQLSSRHELTRWAAERRLI